jgi:conjugal transfer pilus assembly protein TraF
MLIRSEILSKLLVRLLIVVSSYFLSPACYAGQQSGFFDQRYRGWLWFEAEPAEQDKQPVSNVQQAEITPAEARKEIEQFAKELEELKFMMLARPTIDNVRAYRAKERLMWQQAEKLEDSWEMASFRHPEQRDLINNPVNVHAVKLKRQMDNEQQTLTINELAKKFDLILFFDSNCQYCQLLAPVLRNFGEQYGFNIEAISSGSSKHEYFKTATSPQLIAQLGISAFPTVIAVSHDSKTAFELIRGYVSQAELEQYALLASKYLAEQNRQSTEPRLTSKEIGK